MSYRLVAVGLKTDPNVDLGVFDSVEDIDTLLESLGVVPMETVSDETNSLDFSSLRIVVQASLRGVPLVPGSEGNGLSELFSYNMKSGCPVATAFSAGSLLYTDRQGFSASGWKDWGDTREDALESSWRSLEDEDMKINAHMVKTLFSYFGVGVYPPIGFAAVLTDEPVTGLVRGTWGY